MRALLLVLLLAACTQAPEPDVREVKLVLADASQIAGLCGEGISANGCAKGSAQDAKGRGRSCTIIAVQPRNYDDYKALHTLGHELLHCFQGPEHP